MAKRPLLACLLALSALALAGGIAASAFVHRHSLLAVAGLSKPPKHLRAGDAFRVRVRVVSMSRGPVPQATVSYRAVRRVGRRLFVISLGQRQVGSIANGRGTSYRMRLAFPSRLAAGSYRVIACAWPGHSRSPGRGAAACRQSPPFKLASAPPSPLPPAGNPSGPASAGSGNPPTPDTAPPALSLTLSPPAPNGSNGWYTTSPSVHASADDPDLARLTCTDNGATVLQRSAQGTHLEADVPTSGDGSHAVSCTASDAAGNSANASRTFKLDSVAPSVTFTDPNPGATTDDQTPTFGGGAGTNSRDGTQVSVAVYKGTAATGSPVETLSSTVSGGAWSVSSPRLDYGTYTAVASQTDAAGNVGSAHITIDVPAVLDAAGDIASCNKPTSNPSSWTVATGGSTATLLGTTNPDVIAPLGDNAYDDGTFNEYSNCYGPTWGASSFLPITRPTPGNHEYTSLSNGGYFSYFNSQLTQLGSAASDSTKGWYSYDLGHWHIVVLNTSDGCGAVSCAAGSAQEQWLKADLAAHPNVCTLAYWHHPLYTSDNETGVPPETAARPLWQDLYNAHADLILNGHAHLYERFKPQDPNGNAVSGGITEITAGTGGFSEHTYSTGAPNSVALADTYGILELWLGAKSYRFQFLPAAGQTFTDFGGGNCHEPG